MPLYDPLDPLGLKPKPQGQFQPLQPQEENSLLGTIGGKALGGLGWVGDFLDKYTGGRAVRGLLGGRPGELASILPFSDQLGITDEKNKVSGRDLTDNLGLSSKGSGDWLDAGLGIGADILTNPATYLSFGGSALTKAGQTAEKVGALPGSTLGRIQGLTSLTPEVAAKAAEMGVNAADILNQPLGGLAKFHIPFTGIESTIGAGPMGEKALNALSGAGSALNKGARLVPGVGRVLDAASGIAEPTGRYLNSLFNSKVAGATTAAGQTAGRAFTSGVESGLQGARGLEANLVRGLDAGGALDQPALLRQVGEGAQGAASPLGPQGKAVNTAADQMKGYLDHLDQQGAALGFQPHQLVDAEAEYLPRQMTKLDVPTRGYGNEGRLGKQQALPTDPRTLDGREEILKNIPGGTEALNRLSKDPEFSGILGNYGPQGSVPAGTAPTTELTRAEMIRRKYLGVSAQQEAQIQGLRTKFAQGVPLNPDEMQLVKKFDQSKGLENWASGLDPKYAKEGVGFFGNHPVDDFMRSATARIKRNEAGQAVHNLLADSAAPAAQAGPGWMPLNKALGQVGFDDISAAQQAALSKLGGKFGNTPITDLYVPPDALKDAQRFISGFQTPEFLRPLLGAVDWMTNLTKSMQSGLWPATPAKYATQGLWQNFVLGASDPRHGALNPLGWVTPLKDAQTMLRGGTVEGAAEIPYLKQLAARSGRTLTDEEATQQLANLAHQYGATGSGGRGIGDLTGAAQADTLRGKIPGMDPLEGVLGPKLSEFVPGWDRTMNPLNVAGVNANKDVFAPVAAMRETANTIDETARLSGLIAKMRQGFHPEEAAAQVRAAHLDYGALSDFEKSVMKRVIPFYSYTRAVIPRVLEELMQNPGGLTGQAAMATDALRAGKDQFVPDYLGAGPAIPIGKEDNGTQRFLSNLGLPVETAFDALKPSLSDSMMGLLGQTNPLIKGPLEYATGKQFMSGRDLADLYPITGNTLVDQGVMNSPLSRFYTTGRQLLDPRKGIGSNALNLLSGLKVSDVDMDKQRSVLEREALADALRGQQGVGRYETFYARPDQIPNLTPEEVLMLRLQKTLDARAKATNQQQRVGVQQR